MSGEQTSAPCKQRFKGIENFLRRVAFNLGNSPSQTEVKIISCIPIDVSDLQQKIISLEKQLNEATAPRDPPGNEKKAACATAVYTTSYYPVSNTCVGGCRINEPLCDCDVGTSPLEGCSRRNLDHSSRNKSGVSFVEDASMGSSSRSSRKMSPNNQSQPLIICEPHNEQRKNFFRMKRKLRKEKKPKSHVVYYAHTFNKPFSNAEWGVPDKTEARMRDEMTSSYLANMVRRQYRPKELGSHLSDLSQYSSPVCRDSPCDQSGLEIYEPDVFSCGYGQFHNIDNLRTKIPLDNSMYVDETNTRAEYYDSSLYDLVPVKEKPLKIQKQFEMPVKKEAKPHIDTTWCPEVHTAPHFRPYVVNYHAVCPTRNNYVKNVHKNLKRRDNPIEKMYAKRKKSTKFTQKMDLISSKSCCIEFGQVYAKKKVGKPKPLKIIKASPPVRKNAECLTTVINNSECQTITSNVEIKKPEGKTEATLNQIKSILQSVLTEVKTNNQIKTTPTDKSKRDAVVQKGPSQSNLQGSTLLNSFTYSPYNMNPYLASGSHQINPSHFSYPHANMKCLQNFPLIIQSGRHTCNSCFRNNSNIKSMYTKQGITTSTNTDGRTERSKETEKLIKEIYKSMALNADLPTKDTSCSNYEYQNTVNEPENKPVEVPKKVVQAISELFIKKNMETESPDETSRIDISSKYTSNAVSTRTQSVSVSTDMTDINEKFVQEMHNVRKEIVSVSTAVESRTPVEEDLDVTATESESSSSEVESEITNISEKVAKQDVQKKEKKSLFQKMFKSVFKSKEKPKKVDKIAKIESDRESASDSDDYQTVYSHKTGKPRYRKRSVTLPKHKVHSKVSNSKRVYRDRSPERNRSPYMEQEYRRYWNERLMFDKHHHRYSSEKPISKDTTPRIPVYYQNYETRSAIVDQRVPFYQRQAIQGTESQYSEAPRVQDSARPYLRNENGQNRYRNGSPLRKGAQSESKGAKGLAWLKKHKMGIHCGEQWKKLILEG